MNQAVVVSWDCFPTLLNQHRLFVSFLFFLPQLLSLNLCFCSFLCLVSCLRSVVPTPCCPGPDDVSAVLAAMIMSCFHCGLKFCPRFDVMSCFFFWGMPTCPTTTSRQEMVITTASHRRPELATCGMKDERANPDSTRDSSIGLGMLPTSKASESELASVPLLITHGSPLVQCLVDRKV